MLDLPRGLSPDLPVQRLVFLETKASAQGVVCANPRWRLGPFSSAHRLRPPGTHATRTSPVTVRLPLSTKELNVSSNSQPQACEALMHTQEDSQRDTFSLGPMAP